MLHTEVIARGCPLTVVHAAMQTLSVEARWLVVQPPRHECSRVCVVDLYDVGRDLPLLCVCVCIDVRPRHQRPRRVEVCRRDVLSRAVPCSVCARSPSSLSQSTAWLFIARGVSCVLRSDAVRDCTTRHVADGVVCVGIGEHLKAARMALYVALLSRRAMVASVAWRCGAAVCCRVVCSVSSSRAVDAALLLLLLLLSLWLCEVSGELLRGLLCCVGCVGRDGASDC